jgi:hypothetical protein
MASTAVNVDPLESHVGTVEDLTTSSPIDQLEAELAAMKNSARCGWEV